MPKLKPAAVSTLDRPGKVGISLGCQTVLLRGVNDNPKIMMKLMRELLKAPMRPYYICMAGQVAGGDDGSGTPDIVPIEIAAKKASRPRWWKASGE